ncbi:interleukin-36 receptor antagonist protein-like [Mauremys mutica]|uniref:interleukin-36 receptor antagonist protein-like n=1 Tax=Mauremys mutica TaxID=74926 RepID=UPI001D15FBF5|nr:interleukin-36 receptor antagonist protein-like [Mauremys mutica]
MTEKQNHGDAGNEKSLAGEVVLVFQEERVSVVPTQFLDRSKYPIIMGVCDRKCCLSRSSVAQSVLYLETGLAPEDRLIMDMYKHTEESKHCTFNNTLTGSTHRFESATYLGWFRCTSQKSDEPLGTTSCTGESEIIEFYF